MLFAGIDTALVNSGLVIEDEAGVVKYAGKPHPKRLWKGSEDSFFLEHARIRHVADWLCGTIHTVRTMDGAPQDCFVAQEDYLITGFQRSYKTAELNALLKNYWHQALIPYCLVHPSKTHKYVVKKKDVSKTEIIDYVKQHKPSVFEHVDRADYSDIADAWVICQIGRLTHEAMQSTNPVKYVNEHPLWEIRWKELLATDKSGIVVKPGLVKWSYYGSR